MASRKQLSGAQKRALKEQAILEAKKLKGSMVKFLVNTQNATQLDKNSSKHEISVASSSKDCKLSNSSDRDFHVKDSSNIEMTSNVDSVSNTDKEKACFLTLELETSGVLPIKDCDLVIGNNGTDCDLLIEDASNNEVVPNADSVSNKIKAPSSPTSLDISKSEEFQNINNDADKYFSSDPGVWPTIVTEKMREYFTKNKPCQFISEIQHSARFCYDKTRTLTEHSFYRVKKNKEKIKREWLIYSPTKKAVFCYVCKLFSYSRQSLCDEGFTNWKNISERLSEHENSQTHRDSVCKLSLRTEKCKRIDLEIINEYNKECTYWRSVLNRVVSVVKFLAERGLPLFGDDETVGSLKNGNFLGSLELLAKFDPFIAEHLVKHGNPGKGNVNYLSSTIATEILQLMSEKVLKYILAELNEAKYYGLILDSTPDITHIDQLSIVLRYVNKEGEAIERFIKFLPIKSHGAESLSTAVLSELDNLNLDIMNCRGQSYDNASNMAGQYSGLQARMKALCPLAEYVPCAAHSLNLVGENAVQCCNQAVSFFGTVQNIYKFFSSSTQRWNVLQEELKKVNQKLTLKLLSTTRWSAEADATKALRKAYLLIKQTLFSISENQNVASATRHEAKCLYSKMSKLETALMTVIWDILLQRINSVNKSFQHDSYDISCIVPLYKSLIQFIHAVRENFNEYEKEAMELVDADVMYANERKKNISKRLDKMPQTQAVLSGKEAFQVGSHYVICDALIMHLNKRMEAYLNIEERFGFLYASFTESEEKIKNCAKQFQSIYSDDIDEYFPDELIHFRAFNKVRGSPEESLKRIRSLNIADTFPNVDSALHILLTLPISNCSNERSFSVLKRIKNHLRNCISQDNLQAFSLLTIENSVTSKLNFDDLIDEFASRKARKKHF